MQLAVRIARESAISFRAWCPALPGCVVWGRTWREARDKIEQAVMGYLTHIEEALPRELGRLKNEDELPAPPPPEDPLEWIWRRKALPDSLPPERPVDGFGDGPRWPAKED